jgi:hypothetical protein
MDKLKAIIASLNLTSDIKSLLRQIVEPVEVRLAPTESEKTGVKGFNIYGIQAFNKAQLFKDVNFSALYDTIKAESHLNILVNHSEDYETPLIWIGPSSSNTQSKEDKQDCFD